MTGFSANMNAIRSDIATTNTALLSVERVSRAASAGVFGFGRSIRQFGRDLRVIGNDIAGFGLRASLFLTLPFVGATSAVISAGATFEKELTRIITLAGTSADVVQAWGKQILDVSVGLGRMPVELAAGLYEITSAGIRDSAAAMDILTNSSMAASIGMGEVNDVAHLLTAVLQTYGDAAGGATKVTDELVAAVREGTFEADKLATTYGRVIAIAESAHVSMAEGLAFVAAFSRTGVPVDVAVTSLRGVLSAIIKPTNKANQVLAEYGITIQEVRDSVADPSKGLAKTLIGLRTALGDTGFAQFLSELRASAGALAVTGEMMEDYLKIVEDVKNSSGSTADAFSVVKETISFQADQVKAAFNVLGQQIFVAILPALNAVLKAILPVTEAMSRFAATHPGIVQLGLAFGVIVGLIGPMTIFSGLLVSSMGALFQAIGSVTAAFMAMPVVLGGAITGILGLGAVISSLAVLFVVTADDIQQKMGSKFGYLAASAKEWGKNIVTSFASGILDAIIYVVQALTQLGNVIAYWLAPGSPPKILPDLDKWGAGAMESWIEGWASADFSMFNDIAGTLEGYIRSFGDLLGSTEQGSSIGDTIADTILSVREAVTKAVSEFREIGSITEQTMSEIESAMGGTSEAVRDYISSLVQLEAAERGLAEAQDALNATQKRYDDLLKPISSRLQEISDAQQAVADEMRLDELQEMLNDPWASDQVKALAQLEIEQIGLMQQQQELERQRDSELALAEDAVSAAEDSVSAAQEQVDSAKALIQYITQQNDLLQEQKRLMEVIAGGFGGGADAAGGSGGFDDIIEGAGDFGDIVSSIPDGIKSLTQQLGPAIERVKTFVDDALEPLRDKIEFLKGALDGFSTAWANVFINIDRLDEFTGALGRLWETIKLYAGGIFKEFVEFLEEVTGIDFSELDIGSIFEGLPTNMDEWIALIDSITLMLGGDYSASMAGVSDFFDDVIAFFDDVAAYFTPGPDNPIAVGMRGIGESILGFFTDISEGVKGKIEDVIDNMNELPFDAMSNPDILLTGPVLLVTSLIASLSAVGETLSGTWKSLKSSFSDFSDSLSTFWSQVLTPERMEKLTVLWDELKTILVAVGGFLQSAGGMIIAAFNSLVGSIVSGIGNALGKAWEFMIDVWEQVLGPSLAALFGGIIDGLVGTWDILVGLFTLNWERVWEGLKTVFEGIAGAIGGIFGTVVGLVTTAVAAIVGIVVGFVEGVIDFFKNLYDELVGHSIIPDLINDMIEWFMNLPGKILSIITGFIKDAVKWFEEELLDPLVGSGGIIPNLIDDAVEFFTNLGEDIKTAINTWVTRFLSFIEDEIIDPLVGTGGFFPNLIDDVIEFFEDLGQDITDAIDGWLSGFFNWVGDNIIDPLIGDDSVFANLIRDIILFFAGLGNSIISSLVEWSTTVVDSFFAAGQSFFNAIVDGVTSVGGALWSAIQSIASSAWENLKNFFGGGDDGQGDTGTRPPNNFTGTPFFSGGWTFVGEKGPELVFLPRGSRILSNANTMRALTDTVRTTLGDSVYRQVSTLANIKDRAYSQMASIAGSAYTSATVSRGDVSINFNAPIYNRSNVDEATFAASVEQSVARALRYY